MMLKIINDELPTVGVLAYNLNDRAFDTHERNVTGISALQVNSLQIELDETGKLLYVWGYAPFEGWKTEELKMPEYRESALVYEGKIPIAGTSKQITKENFLPVFSNRSKKLICIGDYQNRTAGIKFAPGATAILVSGELVALWLEV